MNNFLVKCGELYSKPFTLVSVEKMDQPLIYVNQPFRDLTQYQDTEILNRNCRFLQGQLTDKLAVERIRKAILLQNPVCEDLLNYKQDGSTFWNRLVLLPIQTKGELFYFGLQHDVTSKKEHLSNTSRQVNAEEVSDWIKNRLNSAILNIEMSEIMKSKELLPKIVTSLENISNYVFLING